MRCGHGSKSTKKTSASTPLSSSQMFCLNFAKYKRSGRFGYKMIPPGKVQVPGFCNSDLYQDVIAKGAKGLGISVSNENLSLIVSNGLIRDAPLPSGNPWTLGGYIKEFGGVQARGKRTFGIFMAFEDQEVESLEEFENQLKLEADGNWKPAERKYEPSLKKQKVEDGSQCSVEAPSYSNISLDYNQSNEPLEILFDDTISTSYGIYCPLSDNKVISSVIVKGRQGIWRLQLGKYNCKEEEIVTEMNGDLIEQPEQQNFFLVELCSEGIIYLKAELDTKADVVYDKINFYVKETRLVHSKTSVELAKNATALLLVISPSHGNVNYKWEQKTCLMGEWQTIKVPPWTCLLYVTSANQYRCTVGTSSILFDVKAVRANATSRSTLVGLSVPFEKVKFNELIGRGSYGSVHRGSFRDKVVALKKFQCHMGQI